MKTVELTTGSKAIPIKTQHYLTKARIKRILTDEMFMGVELNKKTKSEILKCVKAHLKTKGYSTLNEEYEEYGMDALEEWNEYYHIASDLVDKLFVELD